MHAIRSNTGAQFRRSGVAFGHDFWTLVEEPTEDQLNEKSLTCIEVDGPDDPLLKSGLPVEALVSQDHEAQEREAQPGPPAVTPIEIPEDLAPLKFKELAKIAKSHGIKTVGVKAGELVEALTQLKSAE